jgi:NAD(P)-dependent dehydrogenase (short-subunit alcohol dehydrogenase family)
LDSSADWRDEKEENMSLKNQKIVVVGGSSGMGLAAAQALAKAGAVVVIAGRSQEKLDTAKIAISGEVQTYRLDFTDESMVGDFFTRTGKIDHLVVAAAGKPA